MAHNEEWNQHGVPNDLQDIPYYKISKKSEVVNDLAINELQFKLDFEDPRHMIRRKYIGRMKCMKETKSMILVGGTGVGKSSLINTLVNKIYGVQFEDDFRLRVTEKECRRKSSAVSQTEWITVYQFFHMPGMSIDYNLVIIDTPGLNDTTGLECDRLVFDRLGHLLKIRKYSIDELNFIGMVTPASATRLTSAQRYIYDGCMKMFGNDVKDIIHIMATFSDGSPPQIEAVLNAGGVYYTQVHTIQNSSIYVSNNASNKIRYNFNQMCFKFLNESMETLLSDLQCSIGKSLTRTVQTLEHRQILQCKVAIMETKFLKQLNEVGNLHLQEETNNNQEPTTLFGLQSK
ncbi:unnamed protein product, partial [Meganyctiphanes norvegica]